MLQRIINKKKGFYVDVGAHHPKRFSNTYLFYKGGWSGINIDANPGSMKLFNFFRPRDTNIEIGVSLKSKLLTYYKFNEPALNTFNKKIVNKIKKNSKYKLIEKSSIKCKPLDQILKNYLTDNQIIDFLNIDVEGLDLEVLKSNNWNKFKPTYILVEMKSESIEEVLGSKLHKFMSEKNYLLFCKTFNTLFYKNQN